jgi:hypothetical protein
MGMKDVVLLSVLTLNIVPAKGNANPVRSRLNDAGGSPHFIGRYNKAVVRRWVKQ